MKGKDTLARYYETTAIPICVVGADGHIILSAPAIEEPLMPYRFAQTCLRDFELQKRDENTPLVLMMEPSYFIGIAKLEDDRFIIIGPASPLPLNQNEMLNFCEQVVYPDKLLEFCSIMSHTPVVPYRRFISCLSVAVQLLCGRGISITDITLCNNTVQHREAEVEMTQQLFSQREHLVAHTPESYEAGVMDAIQSGNEALMIRRMTEPITGRVGQMAKDMVTQEKYTFISFITMVTRAAIRGGLSQEVAYTLSDSYCQQMDELDSVKDISTLTYQMAVDFCQRVAQAGNAKHYSPVVSTCIAYISQHLHEEIRLTDLSAVCGLSERVLSRKFRDEVGANVADYIHSQKIQEAKYLLKHTANGISDICAYLQYNSQSYFTKVFRDACGKTPQQYRDSIST